MPSLDDVRWELPLEGEDAYDVRAAEGPVVHQRVGAEVRTRRFRLRADAMTGAEVAALEAAFLASRGASGTTTLTPPGESALTVAFLSDRMPLIRAGGDTYSTSFDVEEVL